LWALFLGSVQKVLTGLWINHLPCGKAAWREAA
jgi:hypothetical protein